MPSSDQNFSKKEQHLAEVIIQKDIEAVRIALRGLLAGNQLVMPGFDETPENKEFGKERKVRSVLQRAAKGMKIPSDVFQMAFGRCPDLFLIAEALTSENPLESLNKVKPKLNLPLRPARALRVSDPVFAWEHYKGGDWIVQQKMDGWYGQIHITNGNVAIYGRKGDELSFARTIERELTQFLKSDDVILECEIVAVRPTGDIAPRMEIRSPENIMRAYFFDLLYWNEDWTRRPYMERLEKLQTIFSSEHDSILKAIVWRNVNSKEQFVGCFEEWNDLNGLEGMIAKRPWGIYEADCMTKNFLKIKVKDTVDAVVMGYINAPRSYLLGIFDVDDDDFVPFLWVTIPKDQKDVLVNEVSQYVQNLSPIIAGGRTTEFRLSPEIVVEVEGDKIYENDKFTCGKEQTGKGWSLFAANLKEIRTDKGADDVTTVGAFLNLHTMAGYNKQ
jgi:ATP-dependent DNA ligase